MDLRLLVFILAVVLMPHTAEGAARQPGEFKAGSFILTQQALDEAPYRYADVLRKALDKMEMMDPPTVDKWPDCGSGIRILPAGLRSKFIITPDSLRIRLLENNTVSIAATVDVEVYTKTWIKVGLNFKIIWCIFEVDICGGEITTFKAVMDLNVTFQAFWNDTGNRLSVKIKPVKSDIKDIRAAGCQSSGFLAAVIGFFKNWQTTINQIIRYAIKDAARDFEHQAEVPEEFSPYNGTFVKYAITNLTFAKDHVIFQANATFSALIQGKNITFIPNATNENVIPSDKWNMSSSTMDKSHLLQGVRLSSEFLQSLIWYGSVTNITDYHGLTKVMDSVINSTISYSLPVLTVNGPNHLGIFIKHGLVLAQCQPTANSSSHPATLLRVEFSELDGAGKLDLTADQGNTGIHINLDDIDLKKLKMKPFEPKLPLPESIEKALMKNAMSHMQAALNDYLKSNPLILPDDIAPFASNPVLNLYNTTNGAGYVQILSFCSCSKKTTRFTACSPKSNICGAAPAMKETVDTLPALVANNAENAEDSKKATTFGERKNFNLPNFDVLNTAFDGFYLTIFEKRNCRLDSPGTSAKVYWLWQSAQCAPLFVNGVFMQQYYFLDSKRLYFGCMDKACEQCAYQNLTADGTNPQCLTTSSGQSYQFKKQDIFGWMTSDDLASSIANVFVRNSACAFDHQYAEAQLVSSHTNLGSLDNSTCFRVENDKFVTFHKRENFIQTAAWDCVGNCSNCLFHVENASMNECVVDQKKFGIIFTTSIQVSSSKDVYAVFVFLVLAAISLVYCCLNGFLCQTYRLFCHVISATIEKISFFIEVVKAITSCWIQRNVGNRFGTWKQKEWSEISEDILLNIMLLCNLATAIAFTIEWKSNNNPLLIIISKLSASNVTADDLFDTNRVNSFINNLNLAVTIVNGLTAGFALSIILAWCVSVSGIRPAWMKVRLISSLAFLTSIFLVISGIAFFTYFDELVRLEKNQGFLLASASPMNKVVTNMIKVSLNGASLTVTSFTLAFLFYSVGGGLYCGVVLFRILHMHSDVDTFTTPLVVLTIVQPIISLHPVIIWSQNSLKSPFLFLCCVIWFLPLVVHLLKTLILWGCKKLFCKRGQSNSLEDSTESTPLISQDDSRERSTYESRCSFVARLIIEIIFLILFVAAFCTITQKIINSEFGQKRSELKDFVIPTIVAVFSWSMSTSYLVFSLSMEGRQEEGESCWMRCLKCALGLAKRLWQGLSKLLKFIFDKLGFRHICRFLKWCWLGLSNRFWQGLSMILNCLFDKLGFKHICRFLKWCWLGLSNFICWIFDSLKAALGYIFLQPLKVICSLSCCQCLWHYIKEVCTFFWEQEEYNEPQKHGWRVYFRRLFLWVGVAMFAYVTYDILKTSQNFSSKDEIEKMLARFDINLTWPDEHSALDDVFNMYNSWQIVKSFIMIGSCACFLASLIFDIMAYKSAVHKPFFCACGRTANILGSILVFAGIIVTGLPDYLEATRFDEIFPFCGSNMNGAVNQVAEFVIGLFLAGVFTFQLFVVLLMIGPTLVRAAILVLIHPEIEKEEAKLNLLRRVVQISSFLTFPTTFVSMAIVQQIQKDPWVTAIICVFWLVPIVVLNLGLLLCEKPKSLLYVYYLYLLCYFGSLLALVKYSFSLEQIWTFLKEVIVEPEFVLGSLAEVAICNVVISDMLYMAVF